MSQPFATDPSFTYYPLRTPWPTSEELAGTAELPDVAEDPDGEKTFCATGPGGGVDPTCSPGGGKPRQTETPEFKKWFGSSKVVNDQGKPMVVYHGTKAKDFNTFESRDGVFFFSKDPNVAVGAERGFLNPDDFPGLSIPVDVGIRAIPVYLSIQNPATLKDVSSLGTRTVRDAMSALRDKGFDGFISDYEIVAFSPNQIKSATGNDGTFDPNNPDITKAFCATGPGGGVDPSCSPGMNKPQSLGDLRVKALEFFHVQLKEAYNMDLTPRLSDSQASHYLKEAAACFKKMNGKSLESFLKHVKKIEFYPNVTDLTLALGFTPQMLAETKNRVLGAFGRYTRESPDGTLHLDGDLGPRLARGTYAHEFGHVIDWAVDAKGKGDRISATGDWKEAFKAELADGQLTKYGASNPSEGFAEMHRWLLSEAGIVDSFPMCKAVFKKAGLI